jgi:hypothetical protein
MGEREAVFHSPELINDLRREKRTYEALDALVKALYRCGRLRNKRYLAFRSEYYSYASSMTRYTAGKSMASGTPFIVLFRFDLFFARNAKIPCRWLNISSLTFQILSHPLFIFKCDFIKFKREAEYTFLFAKLLKHRGVYFNFRSLKMSFILASIST